MYIPLSNFAKISSAWAKDQPDNSNDQDCVNLNKQMYLEDIWCNMDMNFICQKTHPEGPENNFYHIYHQTAEQGSAKGPTDLKSVFLSHGIHNPMDEIYQEKAAFNT